MIELAVICALLVGLNAWTLLDRQHERREVAAERRDLLLRIQAPQVAVTEHLNELPVVAPPAVDVSEEGDGDYWEAREEMAQRLAQVEVNGG